VTASYSYDQDSRLTGITYQFGANTLGNLTYTYDSLGRRTQVGGSFARTGLPGAVTSTAYDAANELTNWNGASIPYDANGNMLSDGSNLFTWNTRDQVATLNGVSPQYDAFGRRIKNAAGTSFLYNGADAVQELSGNTVTANLLNGSIDEAFTRSDSSGSFTPLKDAMGSIIALADSTGNLVTSYTYDPFGITTITGTANSNYSQYTGRENEGGGLYYYRARYYSTLLKRFISEDPLGFAGGDENLYAYVTDDPINFFDPSGLDRGWYELGDGYTAGVDRFPEGGQAGFEIHIYKGDSELGIVKGNLGWIAKHGAPPSRPAGIPEAVINKINGINVSEMRANGTLPNTFRGRTPNGFRYLQPGRMLRCLEYP
jgi:RHS repeat-associated protein